MDLDFDLARADLSLSDGSVTVPRAVYMGVCGQLERAEARIAELEETVRSLTREGR